MREILFRGKIVNISDPWGEWIKDGWVYGHLIGRDVIVGEITYFDDEGFATEFWCKVKPETVGQFTGMYDRRKKEIYEGDIIEAFDSFKFSQGQDPLYRGVVEYNKEKGYYVLVGKNEKFIDLLCNAELPRKRGNVTDNPELLEL